MDKFLKKQDVDDAYKGDAPAVSDKAQLTATKMLLQAQKKVRIMIPSTESSKDAVTVQINGYCFNIPRDKEWDVPESVVKNLQDAKTDQLTLRKRQDGEEGNEVILTPVLRYAFQRLQ